MPPTPNETDIAPRPAPPAAAPNEAPDLADAQRSSPRQPASPSPQAPRLRHGQMRSLIQPVLDGTSGQLLRNKARDRSTYRIQLRDGTSAILKLWAHPPGPRAMAKRLLRRDDAANESRLGRYCHAHALSVPQVLGHYRGRGRHAHLTAVFQQDIGSSVRAGYFIRTRLAEGRPDDARRLLTEILDVTDRMIRLGIVDIDHTVLNFLLAEEDGRLYRVDFECAHRHRLRPPDTLLTQMLDRLLHSVRFVTKAEPDLARNFTDRLLARLDYLPHAVLDRARQQSERRRISAPVSAGALQSPRPT